MSWLTGNQIIQEVRRQRLTIQPFSPRQVNPNSYDYRLAPLLRILKPNDKSGKTRYLNPKKPSIYQEISITSKGYLLKPKLAYLGHTQEIFGSNHFASLVTGKSSVARLFIQNHHCAGLIDQGFLGHITLEITCQYPTLIFPNMRFGQIFWFTTHGKPLLYQGKYQHHNTAQPSLIFRDLR